MSLSTWRRVTGLGTEAARAALARRVPLEEAHETTVDLVEEGVGPHALALALAEVGVELDRPRRVAIVSEEQAEEIRQRGEAAQPILAMRMGSWELARVRPLALYERGRGQGEPEHVIWLTIDGEVPPRATRDSRRQRVTSRWTLDRAVVAWVRAEAERRGVPQSRIVEDALEAARGRA